MMRDIERWRNQGSVFYQPKRKHPKKQRRKNKRHHYEFKGVVSQVDTVILSFADDNGVRYILDNIEEKYANAILFENAQELLLKQK
jgi:hypothetical protein